MAKPRTIFFCSNCGASAPKWLGKCPQCGEWNTFQEELIQKETVARKKRREILSANHGRVGQDRQSRAARSG